MSGLHYDTGRDMPPGMQELAAVKIAQQLTDAASVAVDEPASDAAHMEYTCHLCGAPTNNAEQIGAVYVHFCDDCNEQIHREVAWEAQGRTYGERDVICPYCRYRLGRTDMALLEDGDTPEWECECCHQKFDIEVAMVRVYSTKRSICEMPADWQAPEDDE